ncbi:MAG: hypothetical protein FWH05_01430 [Oscillospiraceae bacterium]|nr:hypothetical protein [Oscillospiraceae bacterium]
MDGDEKVANHVMGQYYVGDVLIKASNMEGMLDFIITGYYIGAGKKREEFQQDLLSSDTLKISLYDKIRIVSNIAKKLGCPKIEGIDKYVELRNIFAHSDVLPTKEGDSYLVGRLAPKGNTVCQLHKDFMTRHAQLWNSTLLPIATNIWKIRRKTPSGWEIVPPYKKV